MNNDIVIVLDCGATNVRAVAVNGDGVIKAIHALPNETRPDPCYPGGLMWDVVEIWVKFCACTRAISKKLKKEDIKAIIITTFGVNGAPVDDAGTILYPVISWKCQRTISVMHNIGTYMPLSELYQISGVNAFSFNTIFSLLWLKENHPDILDNMEGFLFMPSFFIHKMTGQLVNDVTMAGTSMLTDLKSRKFSDVILNKTGLPDKFFKCVDSGTIAGQLLPEPASEMGLPAGIRVIAGGHDTQMALIGSGGGIHEPVLSSGTWEVLMARSAQVTLSEESLKAGITNELDAVSGLYDSGMQWLGSGVIEWIKTAFYQKEAEENPGDVYGIMIEEAEKVDPDEMHLCFTPDFNTMSGQISGIGMDTNRQQIFRSALEALVRKTRDGLEQLEKTAGFKSGSLIVVGGGSKNTLWNQLRANALGIPVKISPQAEITVMGAALIAHTALGNYSSIEEAAVHLCRNYTVFEPEK